MVEGIRIIHDDDDIVVVDKPVGVAVHPSMGWTGPTVVGHLRGAGFQIATSGAPERADRAAAGRRYVGVMVIAKSERAYSRLKNAFRHREVDKTYHALVQGHPDPLEGTIDAPIGRHTSPTGSSRSARTASTASPTTRRSRPTASPACWRCTSRPGAPTRSGCTWPR